MQDLAGVRVLHPSHEAPRSLNRSLQFRRSEQASDADSEANVFEASLGFFFFEIFVAVWWWKGILKPGNLQITSIPHRSEACFAFRLINSAFSALVVTVYSRRQAEPDGSLLSPLLFNRYHSKMVPTWVVAHLPNRAVVKVWKWRGAFRLIIFWNESVVWRSPAQNLKNYPIMQCDIVQTNAPEKSKSDHRFRLFNFYRITIF